MIVDHVKADVLEVRKLATTHAYTAKVDRNALVTALNALLGPEVAFDFYLDTQDVDTIDVRIGFVTPNH